MLGSSLSISCPNYILNTIVAEELSKFADVLENANDFEKALHTLIKETIQKHKRIIFNGNGYTEEWLKEAKQRGLLNLPTTADAIPYYITSNNIALFTKHGIFNENELKARDAILYETYYKKCNIEALTMVRMVEQDILPAVIDYENMLLMNAEKKQLLFKQEKHTTLIQKLDELTNALYESTQTLKEKLKQMDEHDMKAAAMSCKESILPQMDIVRHYTDQLEEITAKSYWPYPDYFDLLYRS